MRVGHIGSFNRNLGDNIALWNVQKGFNKQASIEWVNIDIRDAFWNRNNNVKHTIQFLNNQNLDAIVVGGGGLIEYNGYETNETHFKLPFNKHILESLNCPVAFIGLGINYFRGREGFSDLAKQALAEVIEYSSYFSLRNDGSLDILKELGLYTEKVNEIPDPGLIYDYEKISLTQLKNNLVQPAFNSGEGVNKNRYKSSENIQELVNFVNERNLLAFPHTHKDYKYFTKFIISKDNLIQTLQFSYTEELAKIYLNFDSVVALRGHGQLMTVGMNVPGIYFSTQDKVRDFSLQNGFSDYNVDIEEENWLSKLKDKHSKLLTDTSYLNEWYSIRDRNVKEWRVQFTDAVTTALKSFE